MSQVHNLFEFKFTDAESNKKTLILPSLFRPDKPRIPFEDMDCKLRFKVQCMAPS